MPKQFPSKEEAEKNIRVATNVTLALSSNMIFAILIQLFFSKLVKNIWPLYNLIQLIIHLYVLKVEMPVNASSFLQILHGAMNLDAIPKKEIIGYFKENEYTNFVKSNIKYVIIILIPLTVLISIPVFFIIKCIRKSENAKVQKVVQKIDKMLMFSMILRTLLAIYITLCVISIKGFVEGKALEMLTIIVSVFTIACLISSIVFTCKCKKETLDKEKTKRRFGTIY